MLCCLEYNSTLPMYYALLQVMCTVQTYLKDGFEGPWIFGNSTYFHACLICKFNQIEILFLYLRIFEKKCKNVVGQKWSKKEIYV